MTLEEDAPFSFDGLEALAQARLRLLAGARRRLCLHLPRLLPHAFAQPLLRAARPYPSAPPHSLPAEPAFRLS